MPPRDYPDISEPVKGRVNYPFFTCGERGGGSRDDQVLICTGCPKKKLALRKRVNIATHGFKMCILYFKKDKLGPNPSRPLKGHP